MDIIDFELISEKEYNQRIVLKNTINVFFPDLCKEDKIRIASLVTGICHYCFESESGCQCWNDD